MFFSFTFSIPTPFTNPFDAPNSPERPDDDQYNYASPRRKLPAPPRRPIPASPEPSSGLSRKRGRWSPEAKARASSSLDLTTTAAYIDSPAKYVDLGEERVEEPEEPRAPKRRRIAELADSVISTAFSAAVIGTAVGLTAYRLWRDRSNDHNPEPSIDSVPPPPYSERPDMSGPSYVPTGKAQISPAAKPLGSSAPSSTPRRRAQPSRRAQTTVRKRRVPAPAFRTQSPASSVRRSTTYYTAAGSARSTPGPSGSSQNHSANQGPSGDELDDEDMQMSGQMDWMSAQLQALINDGKRALGTEVVVGGQDEVDDGDQNWDDDEPEATPSRAQSRTTTRAPTSLGRSTSRASRPRPARQWSGSASSSVKKYDDDGGFEVLYQTPLRAAPSKPTITDDGESEELRVAMERVRKAYGLR